MGVNENYGVLRIVHWNGDGRRDKNARGEQIDQNSDAYLPESRQGSMFARTLARLQGKSTATSFPEARLVHVLTQRETTIGRGLSNDIILLDPMVSREHARLVVDEQGWHIQNVTLSNIVRVNDQTVPGGSDAPVHSQDLLLLGSTLVQFISPQGMLAHDEEVSALSSENEPALSPSLLIEEQKERARMDKQRDEPMVLAQIAQPTLLPPVAGDEELLQEWREDQEKLSRMGVTMEFALSHRLGKRLRWMFAGIALLVLVMATLVVLLLNSMNGIVVFAQDGLFNVLLALTIPIVPALGINLLVNFIDRFEREPWFLRLAAFLWGALIAIPPAVFIEQMLDGVISAVWGSDIVLHAFLQGLNFGLTEETVKGLGLLLLFFVLRDEFDNVTDGIVYGALIGAGFAMVENFFYFLQNPKDIYILIVGRIVLGWLVHSTYTICFGIALGSIRHTCVHWKHIVLPLSGYILSVGLHTLFDFINSLVKALLPAYSKNPTVTTFAHIAIVGDYIPLFIAQLGILYILIKALAHEASIIREFLASEVSSGTIRVGEYALLQHSFARIREERRILFRYGVKQWVLVRGLYQAEIGLAFRKWHVSMGDKPKFGYLQPEDAYRKRIQRLRQEIAAGRSRGSKSPDR